MRVRRKDTAMEPRIVSRFSCGAASAVATKLVLAEYGATREIAVINAFIEQEHPDNRRFLADCEHWFGVPITVLRDTKYKASTVEVFRRRMYMAGRNGAPCTKFLKRELMDAWGKPDDVWVLGYTAEEEKRLDAFLDANGSRRVLTPLIDRGLRKADCLAMVERAGIELPAMYRLGYKNANCIGCVKATSPTYWNLVRQKHPQVFAERARLSREIGCRLVRVKNKRIFLDELKPTDKGRKMKSWDCGVFCEENLS